MGSVKIQRVHRLNRGGDFSGARLVIARFLRYKTKDKIVTLERHLKGTGYQMFRDFPHKIVKQRKEQMPVFKKARQNRMKVSFSRRKPDQLYINSKLWPQRKVFATEDQSDE